MEWVEYLNVYWVEVLSIHVLMFVDSWRDDSDMRTIHTSDDIWEASHAVELLLLHIGFRLCGEANPNWHAAFQGKSDTLAGAAYCRLDNTRQLADRTLEGTGSIKPQSQTHL